MIPQKFLDHLLECFPAESNSVHLVYEPRMHLVNLIKHKLWRPTVALYTREIEEFLMHLIILRETVLPAIETVLHVLSLIGFRDRFGHG